MKRAFIGLAVVVALVALWFRDTTSPVESKRAAAPSSPAVAERSSPVLARNDQPAPEPPAVGARTRSRASLSLTVLDLETQLPLAGVLVEVHQGRRAQGLVAASARSDETGRVRLSDLPVGRWNVSLHKEGYEDQFDEELHLPTDTTLALERTHRFRGRVVLPDGRPAAGAAVVIDERHRTTTTQDGTFELPASNENWRVCARLGALSATAILRDLASDVRLREEAPLRLRVVDEQGAPLDGVHIHHLLFPRVLMAVTDADGRTTFPNLCGDTDFVELEREGYARTLTQITDQALMELESSVHGTVVDEHGRGVPGASISMGAGRSDVTLTDEGGHFILSGVGRRVRVTASEGERQATVEFTTRAGETANATFPLGPLLARIAVEVIVDGHVSERPWTIAAQQLDGPFKSATRWRVGGSTHDAVYETALTLPTGTFSIEATRAPGFDQRTGSGVTEVRVDADAPPAVLQIYATEKPQ